MTMNKPITTDIQRPKLELPDARKKVLLHSCCAPCSGEVMEAMTASGIDYTIYFYNPNIHPVRSSGPFSSIWKTRWPDWCLRASLARKMSFRLIGRATSSFLNVRCSKPVTQAPVLGRGLL